MNVRHGHEGELPRLARPLPVGQQLEQIGALLGGGLVGWLGGMTGFAGGMLLGGAGPVRAGGLDIAGLEVQLAEHHEAGGIAEFGRAFGQATRLGGIAGYALAGEKGHRRGGGGAAVALSGGLFPPLQCLGAVLLRALRAVVALAQIEGGLRGFWGRRPEVAEGEGAAARDHRSAQVGEADKVHRFGMAGIRCQMRPAHGFHRVVFGTLAIAMADRQRELGLDIALLGGLAQDVEIRDRCVGWGQTEVHEQKGAQGGRDESHGKTDPRRERRRKLDGVNS